MDNVAYVFVDGVKDGVRKILYADKNVDLRALPHLVVDNDYSQFRILSVSKHSGYLKIVQCEVKDFNPNSIPVVERLETVNIFLDDKVKEILKNLLYNE